MKNNTAEIHENVAAQYSSSANLGTRINLHDRFSTNKQGWAKWVFDNIDFTGKKTVLELGCGSGNLWKINRDRIPRGLSIMLSDFSPGMLDDCRKNLRDVNYAFDYRVINVQDIPFEAGSFDIVIANHMLYHVPDRKKALSEICRVLMQDGIFYAAANGAGHLKELRDLVRIYDDSIDYAVSLSEAFGLENGAEQIGAYFDKVNLLRYEDSLEVDDAVALTDYVLSSQGLNNVYNKITSGKIENFNAYIKSLIDEKGFIKISKESGMFAAGK